MKRFPIKALLAFALLGAVGAGWWLERPRQSVSTGPAANPLAARFSPGALPGFVLTATESRPDAIVYTLTNTAFVARIEVLEQIEAPDAETLTQDGVMGIQALYANALSPYPGDISNQVITEAAYRPRLVRATNASPAATYFLLHANERFGYGATTKDAVKFRSLMGWFYCASRKEYFRIKLFAPLTAGDRELEAMIFSMRCR